MKMPSLPFPFPDNRVKKDEAMYETTRDVPQNELRTKMFSDIFSNIILQMVYQTFVKAVLLFEDAYL